MSFRCINPKQTNGIRTFATNLSHIMYSRQEISKQKQAFWTAFGKYMQPILSAEGTEVSWINYKTGIPGISFKMETGNNIVSIAILLSHSNPATQRLAYDKLLQMKTMLESTLGEHDWVWAPATEDQYGKIISTVSKHLTGVSIHRKEDWPAIISFLKPRIIALDEFWSTARYGFEELSP